MPIPFLFLGANTPWVHALADALAAHREVHALHFYDWRTAVHRRSHLYDASAPPRVVERLCVYPPGYAGKLSFLFRNIVRRRIEKTCAELASSSGAPPFIVAPYPYLARWIPRNRSALIYYNLDDYVLYDPAREASVLENERRLAEQSTLILCLSEAQCKCLAERYPQRAGAIHHFPLGVPPSFAVHEFTEPKPVVTYVGNLVDRVDWVWALAVISRCSEVTFRFVGKLAPLPPGPIFNARQTTLTMRNVIHVEEVPQADVLPLYRESAITWIPYNASHPFNRAACPTKIMDGLAAGRPLISTAVPECCLYPSLIDIVHSPDECAATIRRHLSADVNELKSRFSEQLAFASAHGWPRKAAELLRWLPSPGISTQRTFSRN